MRQDKISNYMEIAEVVAKRSHDTERQVGAVLIKKQTGAIIATGYNGFIRNTNDGILPTTKPDKYPYIIHAEVNLISNCAKHGISTDECFIVQTLSPCIHCMRVLWQCGVRTIYFKEKYRDFLLSLKMDDILNIGYELSETEQGVFKLELGTNKHI